MRLIIDLTNDDNYKTLRSTKQSEERFPLALVT